MILNKDGLNNCGIIVKLQNLYGPFMWPQGYGTTMRRHVFLLAKFRGVPDTHLIHPEGMMG